MASQNPASLPFSVDDISTVIDALDDNNWIANLPQLLRYSQDGDVVQVPNPSVLALAERWVAIYRPGRTLVFVVESGGNDQTL